MRNLDEYTDDRLDDICEHLPKLFNRDYLTRDLILPHMGRIQLAGGHLLRLSLAPDGLVVMVDQQAVDDGSVHITDADTIQFRTVKP